MNRKLNPSSSRYLLLIPLAGVGVVAACSVRIPVDADGGDGWSTSSTTSHSDGSDFDGDGVPNDDGCVPGQCGQQTAVLSPVVPPPLSGGTLLIARDGVTAIVSDPDRDRVVVVDLDTKKVLVTYATPERGEPGRATQDRAGRVHVALRAGGGLLSFDPKTLGTTVFTPVCEAPRGLAASEVADTLFVACANGDVFALDTVAGLAVKAQGALDPDLRDVVVSGDKLFVSHMRSTSLDVVDASTLALVKTVAPPEYSSGFLDIAGQPRTYSPTVAWRMIPRPGGGVIVAHQHAKTSAVVADPNMGGGYAMMDCNDSILHTAVSMFDGDGNLLNVAGAGTLSGVPLPVDVAMSHDGERVAIVGAGADVVAEIAPSTILEQDGCSQNYPLMLAGNGSGVIPDGGDIWLDGRVLQSDPEPIALAYDGNDELVVQLRQPSALVVYNVVSGLPDAPISLGGDTRYDSGYLMFNSDPDQLKRPVACASCHPEGREDGHTWTFDGFGARRTQSLAGGISGTEPLHWDGALVDLGAVMDEVFVKRMGGFPQTPGRIDAIRRYIDAFPQVPHLRAPNADAAARGKLLYEDATIGCADCHTGPKLTSNETVDVGTGLELQVPSLLGIGMRAPFMHDGCAPTLTARFGGYCGGGDLHGETSQLTEAQIADLVAYLETL